MLEAELKAKSDQTAWERSRIEKADEREDKRVKAFDDIKDTLIFIQAGMEESNKEHGAMVGAWEKMSIQSAEEHKAMMNAIVTSQNLYNILIAKLEDKRLAEYLKSPVK